MQGTEARQEHPGALGARSWNLWRWASSARSSSLGGSVSGRWRTSTTATCCLPSVRCPFGFRGRSGEVAPGPFTCLTPKGGEKERQRGRDGIRGFRRPFYWPKPLAAQLLKRLGGKCSLTASLRGRPEPPVADGVAAGPGAGARLWDSHRREEKVTSLLACPVGLGPVFPFPQTDDAG